MKNTFPVHFCRFLGLFASSFISAYAVTFPSRVVTKVEGTSQGCPQPPSVFSFSTTDIKINLWFIELGITTTDRLSVKWVHSGGSVYRDAYWPPFAGDYCTGDSISIAGLPTGDWAVRVYNSGVEQFSIPFNIRSPPSSSPTPISTGPNQWNFALPVQHVAQPENWLCGPSTVAMWAGHIGQKSIDPRSLASRYGIQNRTTLDEFMTMMFNETPYGYVFASWGYDNKYAAVKSIMWTIARFNEPVALVGGDKFPLINWLGYGSGTHYLLVRGGRAERNPYQDYSDRNHILGVWVDDSTESAPGYQRPVSGMWRNVEYHPATLMDYWLRTGPWEWGEKKYRSIERECFACWSRNLKSFDWNDSFNEY